MAKLDGKIVAYVFFEIMEVDIPGLVPSRTLRFEELCVADGYRHMGIGKQIMEDVRTIAEKLGCDDIRLTCVPQNSAAIGLYESVGMEIRQIQYRLKI